MKLITFKLALLVGVLLFFSCASSSSKVGRIRELEKRVEQIELQFVENQKINKINIRIDRAFEVFNQRLEVLFEEQGNNIGDLELLQQELENIKREIKLLQLNQKIN